MKILPLTSTILLSAIVLFTAGTASADNKTRKDFADFAVLYSAFNSSFISPEIANAYSIARGKNRGLVNIAILPNDATPGTGGRPALVKGYVSNIFAQQQALEFFEVSEGSATYYLAPFRFENEDFLTFKISVQPDPDKPASEVSFQRTFYHDK